MTKALQMHLGVVVGGDWKKKHRRKKQKIDEKEAESVKQMGVDACLSLILIVNNCEFVSVYLSPHFKSPC